MSDTFDHELDAWESYDFHNSLEPEGPGHFVRREPRKTCKYCGEGNLKWKELDNGWRLVCQSTGAVHSCGEFFEEEE